MGRYGRQPIIPVSTSHLIHRRTDGAPFIIAEGRVSALPAKTFAATFCCTSPPPLLLPSFLPSSSAGRLLDSRPPPNPSVCPSVRARRRRLRLKQSPFPSLFPASSESESAASPAGRAPAGGDSSLAVISLRFHRRRRRPSQTHLFANSSHDASIRRRRRAVALSLLFLPCFLPSLPFCLLRTFSSSSES